MNGIKPLAGLLLAFGATSVSAQGDNSDGFYVGMGLGNYSTEYSDVNDIGDLDDVDLNFDEDEDAFKMFGGRRFNRILAVQVDRYEFEESTTAQDLLNVTQRLSLKLEYEEIEIEDFDEADAAWLTASWRF